MASRDLVVHIIGDDKSLQQAYKRSTAETAKFNRNMQQTVRGTIAGSGAFHAMGRSIAFASSAFLGAAGLTGVMKASIGAASNLAEQTNKVQAIFGSSARMIDAWGKTTATSLGIADDQALEAAGTFGNLFNTVGLAPQRNALLSRSLVRLAADLASFNNATPEEALDALRSGLIGEAEPLRRFGVLLSESRVQQEAMRESGKQSASQLTQQEKLLARYNLILRDTVPAQGDFAKTADGLANAQRGLNAQLRDMAAALGKSLLPVVQDLTKALRDWLAKPENQKNLQNAFEGFGKSAERGAKSASNFKTNMEMLFKPVSMVESAVHDASQAILGDFTGGMYGAANATAKLTSEQIRLQGVINQTGRDVTGEDVGLRGAVARTGGVIPPAARLGMGRTSFQGQMNLLETQLAKALLSVSKVGDRAILVQEQHLLNRWIAQTKDWKKRQQLYADLGRVQDQIKQIDDEKRQTEDDARQKELDAEKNRLEAHRKHIRAMRTAWQEQLQKIRQAAEAVRGEFGPLPFQETPAGILGVSGQTGGSFAKAYAAQTRTFVSFYRDLARLSRRGAPTGLVEQLRGLGPEGAGLVHGLAVGRTGALRSLISSFRERERVVQQIAKADINVRYAGNITINGPRTGATPAATRRGRTAGVST